MFALVSLRPSVRSQNFCDVTYVIPTWGKLRLREVIRKTRRRCVCVWSFTHVTDFQQNKLSSVCHIRRAKNFVSMKIRELKTTSSMQENC